MSDILTRPYQNRDRDACLRLFDANVPRYFAPAERQEFTDFLEHPWPYLVIEREGAILACGGIGVSGNVAVLTWGMVELRLHGQGLGTILTGARLELARSVPGVTSVVLATSQHVQGFYAGFGFRVTQVTPQGFGPGLDRWDMVLPLAPPAGLAPGGLTPA